MRRVHGSILVLCGTFASTAYGGAAIPTPGPHPTPPWVWHHNPVVGDPAPNGMLLAGAPGPGNVVVLGFGDGLLEPTEPWHLEFELIGGPGGNPGGVVAIAVPGGGWAFPYPALAAGAKFQIGFALPGPGEIVWGEGPEVGPWVATYSNFTPAAIGVDGGVSELDVPPPPHGVATSFTFTGDPPSVDVLIRFEPQGACCKYTTNECAQRTEAECKDLGKDYAYRGDNTPCGPGGECIPTVSEWGVVAMALLVLSAGTVVVMRRRAVLA